MARVSGQLKSSANAGQLAQSLLGKVNLKQYYSGAKRMAGFEPIPQSGFSLMPGSLLAGTAEATPVVQTSLIVNPSLSYTLFFMAGKVEIWRQDLVKVATVGIGSITAEMLPDLEFYGEANTVGIFHPSLPFGLRLVRNASNDASWSVGGWPFQFIPEVDLGGTYPKNDDVWEIYFRWATNTDNVVVSMEVDGSKTVAVSLGSTPENGDWYLFASNMRQAIANLPGFGSGVTVTFLGGADKYRRMEVRFSGPLQGSEYDFDASIVNTSNTSALATHTEIGKTAGELLVSISRGGFSGMANYQDRSIYIAPKAKPSAIAMSRVGEYFDLNIESQSDNSARLEALRTEVSETILFALDATYLLVFTDRAEYFASNRTIERNKPLNWVRASAIGTKKGCKPVLMDSTVYFVSRDGGRLYSAAYDAVSEAFQPTPVNDLNNDIVTNIRRMVVQRKSGKMSGDRLWLLREDGRLICCAANVSQDIRLAACEWPVAGDGLVRGISVDGLDRLWATVDRNGVYSRELLVEQEDSLFQMTVATTTDLAGSIGGLLLFEGKTVWAQIDGDIHGPFTVSSGSFQTDVSGRPALVGIWTPPIYESMPYVRVLPNDDVVRRPGKIVSGKFFLEDAASFAIGANNRPARDVPLQLMGDDLDQAKKNYTGHKAVAGLIGACMDPTLTITQVRPGRLRVRDYIAGVKL